MGKGSKRRKCQVSKETETANWESVFGKKKLNIMSDKDREEMRYNDIYEIDKSCFDELDEIDKIIKEDEHQICGSHYEGTEDFRGSDY